MRLCIFGPKGAIQICYYYYYYYIALNLSNITRTIHTNNNNKCFTVLAPGKPGTRKRSSLAISGFFCDIRLFDGTFLLSQQPHR